MTILFFILSCSNVSIENFIKTYKIFRDNKLLKREFEIGQIDLFDEIADETFYNVFSNLIKDDFLKKAIIYWEINEKTIEKLEAVLKNQRLADVCNTTRALRFMLSKDFFPKAEEFIRDKKGLLVKISNLVDEIFLLMEQVDCYGTSIYDDLSLKQIVSNFIDLKFSILEEGFSSIIEQIKDEKKLEQYKKVLPFYIKGLEEFFEQNHDSEYRDEVLAFLKKFIHSLDPYQKMICIRAGNRFLKVKEILSLLEDDSSVIKTTDFLNLWNLKKHKELNVFDFQKALLDKISKELAHDPDEITTFKIESDIKENLIEIFKFLIYAFDYSSFEYVNIDTFISTKVFVSALLPEVIFRLEKCNEILLQRYSDRRNNLMIMLNHNPISILGEINKFFLNYEGESKTLVDPDEDNRGLLFYLAKAISNTEGEIDDAGMELIGNFIRKYFELSKRMENHYDLSIFRFLKDDSKVDLDVIRILKILCKSAQKVYEVGSKELNYALNYFYDIFKQFEFIDSSEMPDESTGESQRSRLCSGDVSLVLNKISESYIKEKRRLKDDKLLSICNKSYDDFIEFVKNLEEPVTSLMNESLLQYLLYLDKEYRFEICLRLKKHIFAKEISSYDFVGKTTVHIAALRGQIDSLKLMASVDLEQFQNVLSKITRQGMTPLHYASRGFAQFAIVNYREIIKVFIEFEADPFAPNSYNKSPLYYILDSKKLDVRTILDIVKMMLKNVDRIPVDCLDHRGKIANLLKDNPDSDLERLLKHRLDLDLEKLSEALGQFKITEV